MTSLRDAGGRLLILASVLVLAAALATAACGGDDDDGGNGGGSATATARATATATENGNGGEVAFDVEMTDERYIPNEFAVDRGAKVTLNLTNTGTAIHNLRIAGEDDKFNTDDDAVSDPDLITGGDTGTVEWTVPNQAGEYKFQCDIHPNLGGTITVE
jgi:plastocyanin